LGVAEDLWQEIVERKEIVKEGRKEANEKKESFDNEAEKNRSLTWNQ
jgi:hypothetical protein